MPPKVLLNGENEAQAVSMHGSVVLTCPVVAGDPPPEITWFKNDTLVQLNDRIEQRPNGSLVIYDASVRTGASLVKNRSCSSALVISKSALIIKKGISHCQSVHLLLK